jgi:TolA-binding protein
MRYLTLKNVFLASIILTFTWISIGIGAESKPTDESTKAKIQTKKKGFIKKRRKVENKSEKKKQVLEEKKQAMEINEAKKVEAKEPQNASKITLTDDLKPKKKSFSKSFSKWLKKMKKRVANSEAKYNQVIAVASVRGNKAQDPTPLYWKGKKVEGPVEMPELKKFDKALDMALTGDDISAKAHLEDFIKTYPNSALVDDAKETLAMLEADIME